MKQIRNESWGAFRAMVPADDYDIGFTGARFGGLRKRRTKKDSADEADIAAMPVVAEARAPAAAAAPHPVGFHEVPDVGHTGARFGGSTRRRREREAHPEPIRVLPEPRPLPPTPAAAEVVDDEYVDEQRGRSLAVRPYFYTKGRTRSRYELAIETLVSTASGALARPELVEHGPLLDLCREPRSIAEVGALLGMPLGVARVVVGDLAMAGGLEVHSTVAAEGPDVALMERVLAGLRRL
jgi:hypothetical protein